MLCYLSHPDARLWRRPSGRHLSVFAFEPPGAPPLRFLQRVGTPSAHVPHSPNRFDFSRKCVSRNRKHISDASRSSPETQVGIYADFPSHTETGVPSPARTTGSSGRSDSESGISIFGGLCGSCLRSSEYESPSLLATITMLPSSKRGFEAANSESARVSDCANRAEGSRTMWTTTVWDSCFWLQETKPYSIKSEVATRSIKTTEFLDVLLSVSVLEIYFSPTPMLTDFPSTTGVPHPSSLRVRVFVDLEFL